ncbi:MAG: histidine kinase [Tannerella sp.]|jgi:sensor histidine kinase YesM|nr:histidine kinase [Tannerella sp.]
MKTLTRIQQIASQPKRMGWLIHSIVWIVLFVFPFLFRARESGVISLHDYLRFIIMVAGTLAVFYANYGYLVERFLFTRQIWTYLLSNLLLFAAVILVTHLLWSLVPPSNPSPEDMEVRERLPFHYFILFDVVKYFFLTVMSVALKATSSWYRMDTERKELEKQRSEAELQNLKNQLNPHFLFNTLNNIYSLIAINGEQAQEAVHELSRLLRYMLYDSAQAFVPLEKEVDFISNYVKLMQIRMSEHVDLQTRIEIELPDMPIAPLLFISPVENAFKHGVSNSKPSFIHIEIIAAGKQIKCLIRNSLFPKNSQDKSGSGIGLVNLRKRLDLLYPGKYTFTCEQSNETYCFTLIIELNESMKNEKS